MSRVRLLPSLLALIVLTSCDGGPGPTQPPPVTSTVPGAPTSVAATAGDAQATVTWQAPASNGGVPVLRYRVLSVPGGISTTVDAPATSATVTGLANETAYTFAVHAINAVGEGPASLPSAPVTPHRVTPPPSGRWVTGYYVGYQQDLYPVDQVDMSLMTHLAVGRIRPAPNGTVIANFDIDDVNGPAMARALSARAHAAGKKAILMLGGAGEHDGFVGAASAANRAAFVTNLLKALDDFGYDGLDVDWEPIEAADRAPLMALLQELRARRPSIILTVPVGWINTNFPGDADAWYVQLAGAVDQVNLMTYDMAGDWGGWVSWHHSALYGHEGNHPSSVAGSIAAYRAAGVPAAKLGIGLGFYGSCWRGVTAPLQPLGAGTSQGNGDNDMSYSRIMALYYQAGARQWDANARVPYLSFATPRGPQNCNFVSYEDAQSIAEKGAYVRSAGLGGAIIWTIGEGHLSSAPAGQRDPLLKAAYESIQP